jgi:RNA polymerase sigma-70 factor (ECF subfamily)
VDDPDLPLIQALQAGDDSALNELIHRYREPLFHFVYRYLRNEAATRDVVQEAFVRIYFKAPQFRPRAMVKTWLYAIALNLSRDQFRRREKHRRREIPLDAPPTPGSSPFELSDTRPTPEAESSQRDRFGLLQQAIDELPVKLREALILFSLEGKTQKEAADILGTTPKAVETRVYQAKHKLRQWLGPLLG